MVLSSNPVQISPQEAIRAAPVLLPEVPKLSMQAKAELSSSQAPESKLIQLLPPLPSTHPHANQPKCQE